MIFCFGEGCVVYDMYRYLFDQINLCFFVGVQCVVEQIFWVFVLFGQQCIGEFKWFLQMDVVMVIGVYFVREEVFGWCVVQIDIVVVWEYKFDQFQCVVVVWCLFDVKWEGLCRIL